MDAQEIVNLLHVVEKTAGHPKLKPIMDKAMKVLETHAAEVTAMDQPPEPAESGLGEETAEEETHNARRA
jgi:hypothetical protein